MTVQAGQTGLAQDIISSKAIYAADAGGTDAYAISLPVAPTSYVTGAVFHFKANTVNTGAATLNVNSLGAKTIKKNYDQDLSTGDIKSNQLVSVIYDGTNFQLLSPSSNYTTAFAAGTTTKDISNTTATTIAHGLGVAPKIVRIHVACGNTGTGNGLAFANVVYQGGAQNAVSGFIEASTSSDYTSTTGFNIYSGIASDNRNTGSVSVDATNITISWSIDAGSPTGTARIMWEAQA